jgi:hypothetical protein
MLPVARDRVNAIVAVDNLMIWARKEYPLRGTTAKCRPGPETSDVESKPDVMIERSKRCD